MPCWPVAKPRVAAALAATLIVVLSCGASSCAYNRTHREVNKDVIAEGRYYWQYNRPHRKKELIRSTENDTVVELYADYFFEEGDLDYIKALQQRFPLTQLNDSTYTALLPYVCECPDRGFETKHQLDFMALGIGKPNGTLIGVDSTGRQLSEVSYHNELPHGHFWLILADGSKYYVESFNHGEAYELPDNAVEELYWELENKEEDD